MDKLNQSFPDPSKFTNESDFTYAAKVTSVYKKVIAELLQIFEMKKQEVEALEKKSKEGDQSLGFDIGGGVDNGS